MSVRDLRADEHDRFLPIYCVWELTLRCDQACAFCGSRAARARPDELTTAELLEVADQLAALGTREVTLIGGEAYLRPDVVEVIARLHRHGIRVGLQTAGRGLTEERLAGMVDAGLDAVGVSVMGSEAVHDRLHGWRGSHAAALRALEVGRRAGLPTTVNTHVCRPNLGDLRVVRDAVRARGARTWRVGLMVPMGRFADHPEWQPQPDDVVTAIDALAEMQLEEVDGRPPSELFDIQLDNTLGYFGPHEVVLRGRVGGAMRHYAGCVAGRYSLGIESDGTIKGCPSLPTAPYAGGNVRDARLADVWAHAEALRFARERTTDELSGFCAGCYYADSCRGGCSFLTHTLLGRRGDNPLCYHRVVTLRRRGVRERLVQVVSAAGIPYDFGRYEIVEEAVNAGPSAVV